MQSQPSTSQPTGNPKPRHSAAASLYAIQVRAFLEAAEVVDTDPEVIEDLLDGFPMDSAEAESSDGDVDVEGGPGPETSVRDQDTDEDDPKEEDSDLDAYLEEGMSPAVADDS